MRHLGSLVGACLSAAALSACGGSNDITPSMPTSVAPLINSAPSAVAERLKVAFIRLAGTGYKKLFSFGGENGAFPSASLIAVNGMLYGTTYSGGGYGSNGCNTGYGCGAVFEVTTSGTERLLHGFKGQPDGANPQASLTDLNGTLYGTTSAGGSDDEGTVFKITTSGKERVLYTFKGGKDGGDPLAGLTEVKGALYGTTTIGGDSPCECGTVFKITTSGAKGVIYSFKGGSDGAHPRANLIFINGAFYGATAEGGGSGCQPYASGCGTVFSVSTAGIEHTLYRFKGYPDGAIPQAGLIAVSGTLYGTTVSGGNTPPECSYNGTVLGCGVVFSLSLSGKKRVLYRFKGTPDGANPTANLIAVNGTLYGSTAAGGASHYLDGTVFKITTSGTESVLYRFKGGANDGAVPIGGLTALNDTLYGTTYTGGSGYGWGTVFKVSP